MPREKDTGILTIAAIRKPRGRRATEYLFAERQAIYTFRSATKTAKAAATRLRQAHRKNVAVKAVLDPRRGVIHRITAPTSPELEEFMRAKVLLDKPDRTLRIDVNAIDPTKFNLVDHHLKRRTFRLCKRIIPSYRRAKEIFDFCADQSCDVPGPHTVSPCIPFQYVIDGCYARAHKMRWIITSRYRYCCEKVFSFANQGSDRLAVRADKWGGCCVSWWYHVAPLVRVKVRLGKWSVVLAMVIDPGMFDKPVLLSSWLAAQKNTVCNSDANVSMYSIQPGSAYTPDNYDGTAFTTDPSYTATDSTLTNYKNRTTCS